MVGFIISSYAIGFIFCMFMDMLWTNILERVYKLEIMPPIDLAFILQEDPKNQMNYIGGIFYDKFDGEVWKENLIKKLANIHRCRAKVVKMFGSYWF
tara:strand:+ start:47 stop:337 length:291 start_codon:yes stop_codon:yes gene_type:complete